MPSVSCCCAYVDTRISSYQSLIDSLLGSNSACFVGNSGPEQLCLLITIAEVLQMYICSAVVPSPLAVRRYIAVVGLPFDRMGCVSVARRVKRQQHGLSHKHFVQ